MAGRDPPHSAFRTPQTALPMTFWILIRRSLRFHAPAHLGVVLGAAIGSAVLIGALGVGDSVRESLRERALDRLAHTVFALAPADRVFSGNLGRQSYANRRDASAYLYAIPRSAGVNNSRATVAVSLLTLPGTASRPSGAARANHVQVFGVNENFWTWTGALHFAGLSNDAVLLNPSLAAQLRVQAGDEVVLRVQRLSGLSPETAFAQPAKQTITLRLKVAGVLPPESGGDFTLKSGGAPPMNVFVPLETLSVGAHMPDQANLLLLGPIAKRDPVAAIFGELPTEIDRYWRYIRLRWHLRRGHYGYAPMPPLASTAEALPFLATQLQEHWTLADAGLTLDYLAGSAGIELRSRRVFLDPPVADAATRLEGTNCIRILTYLANLISAGTNSTPYSMVAAAGPPYTPADLPDDGILVNQWLAEDLGLKPGDTLELRYFLPEAGARLQEATNRFRVGGIVPLEGIYADRTLMPDFPGIEEAESTHDWDAGFPLVHKIRSKDEEYWKKHRGTPKAFVSLAAGQKMWANRFGNLTAIRLPTPPGMATAEQWGRFKAGLLATLKPEALGLRFEPVREQALKAADQSQDFGQLFLGFSLFLVVSALLLMGLLFQLGLERRATEVGTLLALGFTPRKVRRLLLIEGAALALAGGILGALGGLVYAKAMLWGLTTVWHSAIGASALDFHVTATSVIFGTCASTIVAVLAIGLTLRKQARRPVRELLAEEAGSQEPGASGPWSLARSRGTWIALAAGAGALGIVAWTLARGDTANAGAFFGAGALLLAAGLALASVWLRALEPHSAAPSLTLGGLAVRGCARRRTRSLATMALLACGCFIIVAIGVFRLDANRDATLRTSGTGGFALIGESTMPVLQDLNTKAGREAYGLGADDLAGVSVVPLRVREGDEASCLNLNRALTPRLLGVNSDLLAGRFTFASVRKDGSRERGWDLLRSRQRNEAPTEHSALPTPHSAPEEVPAIGDANSIEWALGKKIGDTIDYTDERGRTFRLRLVGAVANSILQGSLIIDEAEFVKRFPSQSGYRMFLVEAPSHSVSKVSATLSRAMQDVGLELTPAAQRLNAFNAVQNTYLGTFQILGGLGLLLGSAGLGVVVLRNVLERRGELGLLIAVGLRRRTLQRLVLGEHGALLALGLGLGILAAAVAVLPALLSPGTQLPYASLALTLAAVVLSGLGWTWLATRYALGGNLLEALRNE